MRIAIAQINYHIGNFQGNLEKMLDATRKAKALKADLVCFSELAISGYPPRDFLEFSDFIQLCQQTLRKLSNCLSHCLLCCLELLPKNSCSLPLSLRNFNVV